MECQGDLVREGHRSHLAQARSGHLRPVSTPQRANHRARESHALRSRRDLQPEQRRASEHLRRDAQGAVAHRRARGGRSAARPAVRGAQLEVERELVRRGAAPRAQHRVAGRVARVRRAGGALLVRGRRDARSRAVQATLGKREGRLPPRQDQPHKHGNQAHAHRQRRVHQSLLAIRMPLGAQVLLGHQASLLEGVT